MKTKVKKLEKCRVELSVEIDAEAMKAIVKDVEKVFLREARLPGFRQGKVPLELIRKNFKPQIEEELARAIFQKHYGEAVKQEKLEDVAIAEVKDVQHDENGGSFVAIVEVKPNFKLPTYKGLKISSQDTTVKQEAIDSQLEIIRKTYSKYEDAKEGEAVASGDFIQIDYSGTVDGKSILEINPEAKIVATGTGFWTQVEDGRFLPEILDAVVGMKIGETKEGVKAQFDKESAPEGLKGKQAEYAVTLKAFRRRVLPTDAEVVEKTKSESIEKLSATIREGLEKQAVAAESQRRENEAVEMLLKKVDFEVPESQVRRAMDGFLGQFAKQAAYSGLDASYFEQNREKILKDAEVNAEKQVRLWYIIDAIAEAEKIEATQEERGKKVIEFVLANAK